jgi:hypothetical protein
MSCFAPGILSYHLLGRKYCQFKGSRRGVSKWEQIRELNYEALRVGSASDDPQVEGSIFSGVLHSYRTLLSHMYWLVAVAYWSGILGWRVGQRVQLVLLPTYLRYFPQLFEHTESTR